jgi:hypothetical protein
MFAILPINEIMSSPIDGTSIQLPRRLQPESPLSGAISRGRGHHDGRLLNTNLARCHDRTGVRWLPAARVPR